MEFVTPPRRALLIALSMAALPMAQAQSPSTAFPSRPITLIVPYAAGGSSDTRARQIAQKLAPLLGQPVVVDNKPGGNGNIGTDAIAKATPDGHTLGIGNLAPLAVNPTLFPRLPFDPARDLAPVVLIEKGPLVLVVSADRSPYKSLAELVKAAKAKPGQMNYASSGAGGSFHLAGEVFKASAGITALHVPYKGGSAATNDLLAGTVDYMFDMVPAALGYLKATPPKMRPLAVAAESRLPLLPDVPTFKEQGLDGLVISNWFGIVVPKATPKAVVDQLNKALNTVLRDPDVAQRITSTGNDIGGGTPQAFGDLIASETRRWSQLIRDKNIKPD